MIRKEIGGKGHIGKYIEMREHIKNDEYETDPSNKKEMVGYTYIKRTKVENLSRLNMG